jgi:hypothetical protein
VYADINVLSEAQSIVRLTQLQSDIAELKNELMSLEIDLVDQLEVRCCCYVWTCLSVAFDCIGGLIVRCCVDIRASNVLFWSLVLLMLSMMMLLLMLWAVVAAAVTGVDSADTRLCMYCC